MFNRYQKVPLKETSDKIKIQKTVFYPEIPLSADDIYVITTQGDRYELLASQFYGDMGYWWIISIANADVISQGSLFIPVGTQLRIPTNIAQIVSSYNTLNSL